MQQAGLAKPRWGETFLLAFVVLYPWVTGTLSRDSNEFKFKALLVFIVPLTILLVRTTLRECTKGSWTRMTRTSVMAGGVLGVYSIILCGLAVEPILILLLMPSVLLIATQNCQRKDWLHPSSFQVLVPLVILVIASCFLTRFQYVALIGDAYRRTGLVTFLCCILLFFSAWRYLQGPQQPRRLIDLLLLASVPVTLLALWQFFLPEGMMKTTFLDLKEPRSIGTFGNPNWFGTYLMLLFPLALQRALCRKSTVWFSLCLLIYAAILTAQNRGAWVASLAVFLFVAWANRSLWPSLLRVALGLLIITGFLGSWHDGMIFRRGVSLGDEANRALEMSSTAGSLRFGIWKHALEKLPKRILLGSGLDTFAERQSDDPTAPNTKAHSIYLEYGVTIGVIGTILYLVFLWKCFASRRPLDHWWLGYALLCGYFVQGIFIHDTIQTWPLIWLLAGAWAAQVSERPKGIHPAQGTGTFPGATTPG